MGVVSFGAVLVLFPAKESQAHAFLAACEKEAQSKSDRVFH